MRRVVMGVGILGAVALLFLLLGSDPDPEPLAFEPDPPPAPVAPKFQVQARPEAAPKPAPMPEGPCPTEFGDVWDRVPPWFRSSGPTRTRFGRRLELGRKLLRLKRELETGAIDLCTARCALQFADLRLLLLEEMPRWFSAEPDPVVRLDIDALFEQGDGASRADWLRLLTNLVEPARDREAFALHVDEPTKEVYGTDRLVRVWTPKGATYPRSRIRAGEHLLRRLEHSAGGQGEHGYDVLAAPDLARGIFPMLTARRGVIGLYFLYDQFAIVDAGYEGPAGQRLLNHELVHAWWDQVLDWKNRFVAEGMAEYLMWLQPTDGSLDVPDRRLANNFAALLRILDRLEARGFDVEHFPLGKLIRASPWGFYGLGWVAYAIAQACFAYVPESTLVAALRSRDEGALLRAFEAIRWADLLAWMREIAGGGHPEAARFHDDGLGTTGDRASAWATGRLVRELFGKGASVADYEELVLGRGTDPLLDTPKRLQAVLERLAEQEGGTVDLVYESAGVVDVLLDGEAARGAPWGGAVGSAGRVDAGVFLRAAHTWLEVEHRHTEVILATADETTRPVTRIQGDQRPLRMDGLLRYLMASKARSGGALVLALHSRDTDFREAIAQGADLPGDLEPAERARRLERVAVRQLRAFFGQVAWRARTVLVIDLGDGTAEARALADAMQQVVGETGLVSYWHLGAAGR